MIKMDASDFGRSDLAVAFETLKESQRDHRDARSALFSAKRDHAAAVVVSRETSRSASRAGRAAGAAQTAALTAAQSIKDLNAALNLSPLRLGHLTAAMRAAAVAMSAALSAVEAAAPVMFALESALRAAAEDADADAVAMSAALEDAESSLECAVFAARRAGDEYELEKDAMICGEEWMMKRKDAILSGNAYRAIRYEPDGGGAEIYTLIVYRDGGSDDLNAQGEPCATVREFCAFITELEGMGCFSAPTAKMLRADAEALRVE